MTPLRATYRGRMGYAEAAALQEAFQALGGQVQDTATRLDGRLAGVEVALRGTLAHRALVRYDAYNELSGQQSMSIALLDDQQSGIVLTCIHHREQARTKLCVRFIVSPFHCRLCVAGCPFCDGMSHKIVPRLARS